MWNPISNKNNWGKDSMVQHARDLSYWDLKGMKQSIANAQKLFNKELPLYDTLYLLKIIDYGQLQRRYKGVH